MGAHVPSAGEEVLQTFWESWILSVSTKYLVLEVLENAFYD
jgi:hypothetical protein